MLGPLLLILCPGWFAYTQFLNGEEPGSGAVNL